MEGLKNIIKEEYEKKYRTQKYEDSVLKNSFEDVVINAMSRVKNSVVLADVSNSIATEYAEEVLNEK